MNFYLRGKHMMYLRMQQPRQQSYLSSFFSPCVLLMRYVKRSAPLTARGVKPFFVYYGKGAETKKKYIPFLFFK